MLYEENFHPEPVWTQGIEDAIGLVSIILSFHCMNFPTFNSVVSQLTWPFSIWLQKMKDLLLRNEKLMWVQEEKVKILAAIWASLQVMAKDELLGFPNQMLQLSQRQPPAPQGNLGPPLRE